MTTMTREQRASLEGRAKALGLKYVSYSGGLSPNRWVFQDRVILGDVRAEQYVEEMESARVHTDI